MYEPTISSLHIGHTSRLDARAAAFSLGPIKTLLLISSLVSDVLAGLLDVCELSDTELSEGESRLALRRWMAAGCGDAAAGDRFLPLPSTRPPPRDLREAIFGSVEESRECTRARMHNLGPGSRASRHASGARASSARLQQMSVLGETRVANPMLGTASGQTVSSCESLQLHSFHGMICARPAHVDDK